MRDAAALPAALQADVILYVMRHNAYVIPPPHTRTHIQMAHNFATRLMPGAFRLQGAISVDCCELPKHQTPRQLHC
jgi:hypothetical protein